MRLFNSLLNFSLSLLSVSALPTDTAAAASKVSGCGKTLYLEAIDVQRTVKNGRTYWYHLPSGYDKNKQYPVVFGFHGSSRLGGSLDGLAFAADSKLSLSKYSGDVRHILSIVRKSY
jgi:poly(3-hydroxybutyrate) depolymerase